MRLPKSEKAQICLSGVGIFVGLLLFYGLPPVLAQVMHRHTITQAEQLKKDYNPELAVVNLPVGEKFVSYGPIVERFQTYITEKRSAGEKPRRLTIFRPGITTARSWEVYIYIQEQ